MFWSACGSAAAFFQASFACLAPVKTNRRLRNSMRRQEPTGGYRTARSRAPRKELDTAPFQSPEFRESTPRVNPKSPELADYQDRAERESGIPGSAGQAEFNVTGPATPPRPRSGRAFPPDDFCCLPAELARPRRFGWKRRSPWPPPWQGKVLLDLTPIVWRARTEEPHTFGDVCFRPKGRFITVSSHAVRTHSIGSRSQNTCWF